MKKAAAALILIVLIPSVLSGCGGLNGKGKSINSNPSAIAENKSANDSTEKSNGNSAIKKAPSSTEAESNVEMQNLSNQMDKLESAINGLDDSNDINETENLINNNLK